MRTLRDAVYGLAVGDALGLPVQFEERGSFHVEKMTGYGTYNMAPGTWSDDTSLTLATCDSIKLMGRIDLEDLMCCMTDWYKNGKYTPDGKSFDVGMTTGAALSRGEGLSDEASNGNGSLMRIIPLAFLPGVTDDEIREVSALTHGHRISKSACVTYIHIARELLQGRSIKEAVETAVNDVSECVLCGKCTDGCPGSALEIDRKNRTWTIDPAACVQCDICVENCPKQCLSMNKEYVLGADDDIPEPISFALPERKRSSPGKPAVKPDA